MAENKFTSLTPQMQSNADLINFQQDAIDYLYDLEPNQNNLFWAGNFKSTDGGQPFYNSQFRIKSIKLGLPKLEFKEHLPSRTMNIDKINYSNSVSIQWIEDAYRSVTKYHLDWIRKWYNRDYDCLVVGTAGKLRLLDVILFHYTDTTSADTKTFEGLPGVEPILKLSLRGLAPKEIGDLSFDASEPGSNGFISCTYSLTKARIDYWNGLREESDNLWNPTTPDGAGKEKKRIGLATSSDGLEDGEGAIV